MFKVRINQLTEESFNNHKDIFSSMKKEHIFMQMSIRPDDLTRDYTVIITPEMITTVRDQIVLVVRDAKENPRFLAFTKNDFYQIIIE